MVELGARRARADAVLRLLSSPTAASILTIRESRIDQPVAANSHPRCAAAGATSQLVVVFMGVIVACELLRVFTAGPSITAGAVPIPNDQLFLASRRGIGGGFGRPTTTGIASHLRIFCLL